MIPKETELSIVIPVKGNQSSIDICIRSLLAQDFTDGFEVIVVVDADDPARDTLQHYAEDPRLVILIPKQRFPLSGRDANWRRGIGMRIAKGRIIALTDADMAFEADWASKGVALLRNQGIDCLAGTIHSIDKKSFWGRYIDNNVLGAKTPRYSKPMIINDQRIRKGQVKPGITANMFLKRNIVEHIGYPRPDFIYTYDDYAYFQEILAAGFQVLCTPRIAGAHHHRQNLKDLSHEYHNSGQGCGDFVHSYPSSPFAKLRLIQFLGFALLVFISILCLLKIPTITMFVLILGVAVTCIWSAFKIRETSGFWYPIVTIFLGTSFAFGFLLGLLRGGPENNWRGSQRDKPTINYAAHIAKYQPSD
jgi:glycosyltransferase involved in cell wall biosynthesis